MKKYIAIEVKDVENYLSEAEQLMLSNLIEKMCDSRQHDNKSRVPEIQYEINS